MEKFKDVALRWFILALFTVIGVRTLKSGFNFSIVFNNEFFIDLIIAGLCGIMAEWPFYNNDTKKNNKEN